MKSTLARLKYAVDLRVHDRRLQNRLQAGSAVALGVGLILAAVFLSGLLDRFQSRLRDFLYQPQSPSGQVVLVTIDEMSIAEVGPWPWPRPTLARLMDALASFQPRVLAFDLVLLDSAPGDSELARALERVPSVVQPVLSIEGSRLRPADGAIPRFETAVMPPPNLQTRNTTLSHVLVWPDPDQIVRRVPVAIEVAGKSYTALGIAALRTELATPVAAGGSRINVGGWNLPVDARGQMYVDFTNPAERPVISALDVLTGRVDPIKLRDKIVLLGLTAPDLVGKVQIPIGYDRRTFPIEIQADLAEMALRQHGLVEQDRLNQILTIFLMALLAGATLPHLRLLPAAGLTILYFVAYLGYAFQVFADGVLVQPLYPALALVVTFACTMTVRYFDEDRQRALVRRLFRRNVPPDVVDQVLDVFDHGVLPLEGARRDVTVLSIDLREFNNLTETLEPQTLVHLLDQYMALMHRAIFRHKGSIVQVDGETILAVWNLPLLQSGHARAAVAAAMEIRRDALKLSAEQPKETAVSIGMGIATGGVVAGHIGSSGRPEYTLVGEVVSLAERLAIKPERSIYIDAETLKLIGDEFETREVNPVRLRRKTDPAAAWQVCEPVEL